MRVPSQVIGLLLTGALAMGCAAHAEPLASTGTPTLNAPEPPVRYVLPATEQQTLPQTAEEPPASTTAPVTSKPSVRPQSPRPAPPPAVDPPVPTPTPAPAILSTAAANADFERRVEEQLRTAQNNLRQVSRPLGRDAQAQFDAAEGFIRQAKAALKVKNVVYAGQLADKAATMAALLRK